MEGSIHNSRKVVSTDCNVLWTYKLSSGISNDNKWDPTGLINTREVASFIDNVIVEMEEEKGHDKVVEEVVKRLAENNLYVKSEKYK